MSDHKQEPASISQQPDAENKKKSGELSEEALEKVTGGGISVTKPIDSSTPKLYQN
jgi:type VI protein secretion system component Hcp